MRQQYIGALRIQVILTLFLTVVSSGASASTVFLDNFEDGDTSGWLASTTGGSGSTGVGLNNSSQMAFVQQTGNGSRSLSMDFGYSSSENLSFDMHALANSATSTGLTAHAKSGVTVSFLNAFNISLGSIDLVRATNPASLGPNDSLIDDVQHNYSALMSDYAALAGLGISDPISKLSLIFYAAGETNFFGTSSQATVWFDNVTIGNVSAVPVPAAVWLFGSGLLGLIGTARRKARV